MKKITLIKSLLGFSLIGGTFLTTALTTTNCGNPGNVSYNANGTNWPGYISGALLCTLDEADKTCEILVAPDYAADETFTIPKTIVVDGVTYTITSIGSHAFDNSLIAGVNLNDVTWVKNGAFMNCKNLTKVNLGNVTTVQEDTFYGCDKLSQVDLNNVTFFGSNAFAFCPLSSITINPNNPVFTWWGRDDIHNGFIWRRSDNASGSTITPVCGTSGGIACGNFSIPTNMTTIDNYTFARCDGITFVDLNNIATVNDGAFAGCVNLTEVKLRNVTSLGSACFGSCPLQTITLDSSSTTFKWVGNNSHNGFIQKASDDTGTTLSAVCGNEGGIACGNFTIPEGFNTINTNAFLACAGVTNVTCNATIINQKAFYDCTNLVSLTCPLGIVTIGKNAFENCASLNSINLASATTIGELAFENCVELTNIYLSALVSLGSSAFDHCTNLRTLELGEELTSIGNNAFGLCPLEDVQLQPGNTAFDWVGDRNNGFLQNADDETTLTPVCEYGGGIACGNVTIPSTITAISDYCFVSAAGITSIDLSAPSALEFGRGWNASCQNLSSVTIGSGTYSSSDEEWMDVGTNEEQCFLYAPSTLIANAFKLDIIKDVFDKWDIVIQ